MTASFAKRFARISVKAARSANRIAVLERKDGNTEAAQVWREVAKVNIAEAKNRKAVARQAGEW